MLSPELGVRPNWNSGSFGENISSVLAAHVMVCVHTPCEIVQGGGVNGDMCISVDVWIGVSMAKSQRVRCNQCIFMHELRRN